MQVVAIAVVFVGLACVIVGLVLGTRSALRDDHLQAGVDENLMRLLADILKAPRDKGYFVGGLLLVVAGLALLASS